MKKETEAYKRGLAAAKMGRMPKDNPYIRGEQDYDDWLEGLIDTDKVFSNTSKPLLKEAFINRK